MKLKQEIKLTISIWKYSIKNRYYLKPFTDLWAFYIKPEIHKLLNQR